MVLGESGGGGFAYATGCIIRIECDSLCRLQLEWIAGPVRLSVLYICELKLKGRLAENSSAMPSLPTRRTHRVSVRQP